MKLSFSNQNDSCEVLNITMLRQYSSLDPSINEEKQQQYVFSLNLMSIDQEYLQIPEENPDCTITMQAIDFCDCIRNVASIGSTLELKTIGKVVEFNSIGDIGKVSMLQSFCKNTMKFNVVDNYILHLNIKYLLTFCKGSFFSKNVQLRIKKEQPLQMRYEDENGGFLEFFLAPKFEDD